jgi:glutamine synthetase
MTIMRNYEVIRAISDAMEALGWEPYQCDHEDACGQYELNWKFSSSLVTADHHSFFKYMVRTIAEQYGMRATFMPKPFDELTGSGCHAHISVWRGESNIFLESTDRFGLSETCYEFIKMLLQHAPPMAFLTNPIVNSYKRLNARSTMSGATWSPTELNWGGNDRTKAVRVPARGGSNTDWVTAAPIPTFFRRHC